MMRVLLAIGLAAASPAAPVLAQDSSGMTGEGAGKWAEAAPAKDADNAEDWSTGSEDPLAGLAALLGGSPVEPLTPEQQARLPQAAALVDMILPPGALAQTAGGMFDGFLGPVVEQAQTDARGYIAGVLGMSADDLAVDEAQARTAAAMLDPQWEERQRREAEAVPVLMERMMTAIEPPMRAAMSELYAINFSTAELADIAAFFATPSGAAYARQSLSMASDQRLVSAAMAAMPAMLEAIAGMEAEMAALTADLPAVRAPADLAATERKQLASLLGMTVEDLDAQIVYMAPEPVAESDSIDW